MLVLRFSRRAAIAAAIAGVFVNPTAAQAATTSSYSTTRASRASRCVRLRRAVPNHTRAVSDTTGLFADALQANWTVSWAAAENARTGSPLKGVIDTDTLLLAGHTFGGATGLSVSTGITITPFTSTIARWAPFLLAQIGDTSAKLYVYGTGDAADSNVETKHLL
ncbi:hypothetical protein ACIA5D_40930 [Actinoplanes sp. NPDC051513]|uniref:hypothetical protein n=1 Tax=Actinoplanes sp. NPDC051513 TaxID=3363908 RepID=UPI0037ABB513